MGRFSKKKAPTFQFPTINIPTGQELYNQGWNYGQANTPQFMQARETALGNIATPEKAMSYYGSFQPTSFEQALSNQYFQNAWPETQRTIKHGLSLSGMEYSPILAEQLGKAQGTLQYDIGSYLANQANQRANDILNSQLAQNPYSMVEPFVGTVAEQNQRQFLYELEKAKANYQNEMARYNEDAAGTGVLSSLGGGLLGAGLGALLAAPTGGMSLLAGMGYGGLGGATAGGILSPLWGGGQSPIGFQDALSIAQLGMPVSIPKIEYVNPYAKVPVNNTGGLTVEDVNLPPYKSIRGGL